MKKVIAYLLGGLFFYFVFFREDEPIKNSYVNNNYELNNSLEKQVAQKVMNEIESKANEGTLVDKNQKINEFRYKIPRTDINEIKTKILSGVWLIKEGEVHILQSSLSKGQKIIFNNENDKVGTGWGTIFFNRYAKFYFTEHGSYGYDYYVSKNNKLVLIQYEYYDEEANYRKEPKPIFEHLDIKKIDKEIVEVQTKGKTLIFQKQRI
jgi:hypothetical protein